MEEGAVHDGRKKSWNEEKCYMDPWKGSVMDWMMDDIITREEVFTKTSVHSSHLF